MGIITNSMSGAGDKGQGYIDVTNEVPANLTAWSSILIADFLKSCYNKGYRQIYFSFGTTDKYTLYCICSGVPFDDNSTGVWTLEGTVTTSKIAGNYRSFIGKCNPNSKYDDSCLVVTVLDGRYEEYGAKNNICDLYDSVMTQWRDTPLNGRYPQSNTHLFDMYTITIKCPTAINSMSTELTGISNSDFLLARKIFLTFTNSQTINGKTFQTKGIELYANEMGTSKDKSQTFTGGIVRDADDNEYDVQIRTPYSGTVTYTLNIIQRSIKLTDNSTSGTFTDYEISTLQNGTKQIELNNEIYKLSSTGADSITFTSLAGKKHINIVISTKAWTLVEETAQSTCYDTNETIDFTAIYAEVLSGVNNNGKIRPFTNNDTLLSADAIKKIIDGNYTQYSFNAKLDQKIMRAYMQLNYFTSGSTILYYTFKGRITIPEPSNPSVWVDIEVQMEIAKEGNTYDNVPSVGYFRMTRVDVVTSN